jgi:sugar O-acyltransferase (sialic acid O-acetyltransferase NeuD family)
MKPLVIFGIGKISEVVFHHFKRDSGYDVVGFTCDERWLPPGPPAEARHMGLPVIGFAGIERTFPPEQVAMFIAVGYQELNAVRTAKCAEARARGYRLASYVSKRADQGPWLEIGDNCLILDSVGIQPGVRIGNNVSIWNSSLIGHHSTVADNCWIAAGATLGGMVNLGASCFVGLGATIGGEVAIGDRCFIGAGTLITKPAEAGSVFVARDTEKYRLDSDDFLRITKLAAMGR